MTQPEQITLPYVYYVVWSHPAGWGSMELARQKPLDTLEEIRQAQAYIASETGRLANDIAIVNWRRLAGSRTVDRPSEEG